LEGALVVIEPPGQAWVRRILEIDDGVHVAIKHRVIKEVGGFVSQPGVSEFRVRVKPALDEAGEKCSGSSPVETMVVIEDFDAHGQSFSASLKTGAKCNPGERSMLTPMEMSLVFPRKNRDCGAQGCSGVYPVKTEPECGADQNPKNGT